jgi:hypothetical protein
MVKPTTRTQKLYVVRDEGNAWIFRNSVNAGEQTLNRREKKMEKKEKNGHPVRRDKSVEDWR